MDSKITNSELSTSKLIKTQTKPIIKDSNKEAKKDSKIDKQNEKKQTIKNSSKRFVEIDFLKGLAVVSMILFHIPYLAHNMGLMYVRNMYSGLLGFLARFAQTLFLGLVGINLVISYQKNQVSSPNCSSNFYVKQTKRSFKIMGFALILSYLTYLAFPDKYVKFGILHFVASAIFIEQWFVGTTYPNYILLILILVVYKVKDKFIPFFRQHAHPMFSFILGIYNDRYSSLDHFPIVPRLAYVIVGVLIGKLFYCKFDRRYEETNIIDKLLPTDNKFVKAISFLGKYSFIVYLLHFPILYGIFFGIKKIKYNNLSYT